MKIEGRTFVVSGGASGLGRASVEYLHGLGGYVAILDMNAENGQATVKELGGKERAQFFEVDTSDTESVEKCVESVVEWTKSTGKQIGGILAAAGVGNPGKIVDASGEPISLEAFDFVLGINLRGVIDLVRQLLPTIIQNEATEEEDNEKGVVIFVSSVAAFDGQTGQLSYSASKGALASITLPMARDLSRHGVRVVAIAPGIFESNMTKMMPNKVRKSLEGAQEFPKRMGRASEFASLVVEVLRNRMLNATTIRLDGGVRMPSKM